VKRGSALAAVVALALGAFFVDQWFNNIDWDKPQRGHQKIAYVEMRRLMAALERCKAREGGYPRSFASLQDDYVDVVKKEEYSDNDYAEFSWKVLTQSPYYRYSYQPSGTSLVKASLALGYELRADPIIRGKTGFRSYYTSDRSDIRWNDIQSAGAADPPPDIDPVLDLHSYWTKRACAGRTLCFP
jgi:hypothetical protein